MAVDPERQVCVTCGSTEAMIASMLGVIDPGDEVIVFEPFYENYGPDAILAGAVPRFVTLREPDWSFDEDEAGARLLEPHAGDHRQHAEQPDRQGLHARASCETIARPVRAVGRHRADRRDLRAHHVRGRRAHPADHRARDGGPHHPDQRDVEDVFGDRLACRLDHLVAGPDGRCPQGPRLPDRRRGRPAPGGRRDRAEPAGRLLREDGRRVPRTPRLHARDTRGHRASLLEAARRLLRDDRHHGPRIRGRRGRRGAPGRARSASRRCRARPSTPVRSSAARGCASRSASAWRRSTSQRSVSRSSGPDR